ncbi:hypothetical protein [Sinorhizobium fredii]|uniref:hypothetical protein n=1 Tax=Rhizobium fredii TaxID=380 RepID=UPI0035194BE2
MSEDTTFELKSNNTLRLSALGAVSQSSLEYAKQAVIRVGDGRGFIAQTVANPVIITCAHCLPHMPPATGAIMMTEEKTYPRLVGGLSCEPTITVECLFVDPVADVAVLGEPDGEAFFDEAEAYRAFVEKREDLPIAAEQNAALPGGNRKGAWLTLGGKWLQHSLEVDVQCVWTCEQPEGGMSGSPIILDTFRGSVVGIVASTAFHPRLVTALPAWLLRQLVMG